MIGGGVGIVIFLFVAPVVIGMWMIVWVLYRIARKMIQDGEL